MNNDQVYDFGVRLRQIREDRGLSRTALAKKLGVSKETVYRYENNIQSPSLDRTKQIAVTLRTSVDYLVGLDNTQLNFRTYQRSSGMHSINFSEFL